MALSCFEKKVSLGDEQHFGRLADRMVTLRHCTHSSSENKGAFSEGRQSSSRGGGASNKLSSSIMYTFFILALFLWYFWYFYWSFASPVAKPQHGSPNVAEPYRPSFEYSSKQDKFRFRLYNRVAWERAMPDALTFRNKRIVERDACHDAAYGENVPATGLVLYRYLRDHPTLLPPAFNAAPDEAMPSAAAAGVVRKGRAFYFTCREKRVWKLRQCPSGQTFVRDACVPVTACTEQEDGVLLPTDDQSRYVRCEGGRGIEETCPADTFFLLDGCRSQADLSYYCQFTDESFFLDNFRTRIDCVEGRPEYVTCPEGHKFFDLQEQSECEPTACEGLSDGTLVPSGPAKVHEQTFAYVSSFAKCVGGRMSQSTACPPTWDVRDPANEDRLLQLPMVFDGEKCAVPHFCVNVQPVNQVVADVVVPLYAWRRHVANWRKAALYDHLEGIACGEPDVGSDDPATKRKRVAVSPGDLVHPKRFRIAPGAGIVSSDCNDDPVKIPVAGTENVYYECKTLTETPCPEGQKFNGDECRDPLPHPFRFRDRDVFRLDGLSHDNWIVPWKYVPKGSVPPLLCHGGDFPIRLYNLCSHQDCGAYPFLSQLPSFSVFHPDGYRCYYDGVGGRLKKETVTVPPSFDFWTQQQQQQQQKNPPECVPGQRLQTGHFVWDSVFYATCDPEQPFVFCPSSDTAGIVQVETTTSGKSRYACRLPDDKRETSVFGPTVEGTERTEHFELNEIARIRPTRPDQQVRLQTGDPWSKLPAEGKAIRSALDLTVRAPVVLHYRYRVTHPPDVVFHHQDGYKASPHGGGFVVRRADFTQLPLTFPEYTVEPFVSDFD